MHRHRALTTLVVVGLILPISAGAHDIETHLSQAGLAYLSSALPDQLPAELALDPITATLYGCSDGDATITQRDTQIALEVFTADISQPRPGAIRVDLEFSADVSGNLYFDKPFLCAGSLDCTDTVSVGNARAVLELSAPEPGLGLQVTDVDIDIDKSELDIAIRDCALATLGTEILRMVDGLAIDVISHAVETYARAQLGPALIGALGGLAGQDLSAGPIDVQTSLTSLDLTNGIRAIGDVDISGAAPLQCFADPGEPSSQAGHRPDTPDGAHLGLVVNLGLVDDLLYHAWASGSTCDGYAADASFLSDYLPEFPAGTTWVMNTNMLQPPRVIGASGEFDLTIEIPDIGVELTATRPNGSIDNAQVRMSALARVVAAPYAASLKFEVARIEVVDIALLDEIGLARRGFDAARIAQMINDNYLPNRLAAILADDVTIPLGVGSAGFFAIIRELRTDPGHLSASADLFAAPKNDTTAPDTNIADVPTGPVNPSTALVSVTGDDSQVPTELLRYQVRINGVEMPDSVTGWFRVGVQGITQTYSVQVAAMDLAGNIDASPATLELEVDGVRPTVTITGQTSASVEFTASDDSTAASQLDVRLEIANLNAPGSPTQRMDLDRGARAANIEALPAGDYRLTVVVTDEAGNEGVESTVETVGGGCATGGTAGSWALVLLALALMLRPRLSVLALLAAVASSCAPSSTSTAAQIPACSSALGRAMWSSMQPVEHNSTVPAELALATNSYVDPQLYIAGPQIFGKWAELVAGAQKSVVMQFYKWEPYTDPTESILAGMKQLEDRRRAAGASDPLPIRILIDTSAFGAAAPITNEHMPVIMEQFSRYDFDPSLLDIVFAVDERSLLDQFGNLHVKTVAVDARVGMITGANPEAQHNYDQPWHDIGTVVYGDAVAAILADFDYSWADAHVWTCGTESGTDCLTLAEPVEHPASDGPVPRFAMQACAVMALTRAPAQFSNNFVDNPQDQAYLAGFANAEHVIKIETPNINDDAAKAALIDAARRGVKVELITSKEFNESAESFVGGPNGANVDELYRTLALLGIGDPCSVLEVRWYSHDGTHPVLGNGPYASHVKYASFDDQIVIVGTTNMDTASWNFSHELNLAVDDAAIARELNRQLFDADWDRAVPVAQCH